MPFAGFADHDACAAEHSDKRDPDAYCAAIRRRAEKMSGWRLDGLGTKGGAPEPVALAAMERDELGQPRSPGSRWSVLGGEPGDAIVYLDEATGECAYHPGVSAKAEWSEEEGPRGGTRWVSSAGEVRYREPAGAGDGDDGPPDGLLEAEADSRDGIEGAIAEHTEPYGDAEPEEGDRVVDAHLEMPEKTWTARVGTVTEVSESDYTGTSVDVEFDDGSTLTSAGPRRFGSLDGGADDGGGEAGGDGREPVSEALDGVDPSDPSAVADAIGIDHSNRTEFRELADEEQHRLRDGIAEAYGGDVANSVYSHLDGWKEGSGGAYGSWLENGFDDAAGGLWGESFRDNGIHSPDPDEARALGVLGEVSRDFVREEYGDEVEVHRGISRSAWENYDDDDEYPLEMSSLGVMTHEADVAESFADEHGSASVSMTVPADEVVFAMDATTDAVTGGGREGEIHIMGGPRSPDGVTEA